VNNIFRPLVHLRYTGPFGPEKHMAKRYRAEKHGTKETDQEIGQMVREKR
jgi:hypothetical protein